MAKPPAPVSELIAQYGPHLNYSPPGGWQDESQHPAQRLVKTHCCFCGQQCGIQLKVRDNQVIGFEPWEEFPFNRGMLCPKGVKRYLQGSHPDRLLDPLIRGEKRFRKATWEEALDTTARRLREIQERYGPDAVAVYAERHLPPRNRTCSGNLLAWRWARATSITTADCAWCRPESLTNWHSAWIALPIRGVISRKRKCC